MSPETTFLAPSFCVFFEPRILAFLAPVVVGAFRTTGPGRTAEGGGEAESLSGSASGDFGLDVPLLPFAPGLRNGDAVLLPAAGVPARDGGLLGRLIEGLSQDEKKSSSGSAEGVEESSGVGTAMSVITTSFGYLQVAWLVIEIEIRENDGVVGEMKWNRHLLFRIRSGPPL
jgi:hypothetical protein